MWVPQKALALFLVAFVLAGIVVTHAFAGDDPIVAFNTSSLKYHCPSCEWAIKCTKNCININRSEAIKRGGVACKVCGGVCR